jgi:hypothetical protein
LIEPGHWSGSFFLNRGLIVDKLIATSGGLAHRGCATLGARVFASATPPCKQRASAVAKSTEIGQFRPFFAQNALKSAWQHADRLALAQNYIHVVCF